MATRNLGIAAGVLALGLATLMSPGNAQGPLYDQVNVSLPYTIVVGDKTLQPGDYWIRQLPSPGGAGRVLLIYSNNGMKFETSAMSIPTLDNRTPEDTKVVLHHFGDSYYFDKIWIQGKNYGYEFPLPDSVKARERERMEPASIAGRYEPIPSDAKNTTEQAEAKVEAPAAPAEPTTTAQNTTPAPEPTPAPAEPQAAAPTPAPEPAPAPEPTVVAQNATPAPEPSPEPTTSPAIGTADREMPATSANWLMMLLGGGLVSGAGLVLRRKQ